MKIAFTSCTRIEDFPEQPRWLDILEEDPDILILLGDNIYMDYGLWGAEPIGRPKHYSPEKFDRIQQGKYEKQMAEPHFKKLLDHMKAKNGFIATWDDHDFAWNDCLGKDPKAQKFKEN